MVLGEILVLGALGAAVLFLVVRLFCKGRMLRLVLVIPPAIILGGLVLVFVAASNPGPFSFVLPYEHLGTWKTTDSEGNECEVNVFSKYLSNTIPPGVLPRVKLVASCLRGRAVTTLDTGWRFGVGTVRPVPGGMEIFHSYPHGQGIRFQLKGNQWSIAKTGISEATSLWEDKLEGKLKVGMAKGTILDLVRGPRSEDLPDLEVDLPEGRFTQHSLDRQAAVYAKYSASGVAEAIQILRRTMGTLDELKDQIGEDLFPLVRLIHGAPPLGGADPVGLIRAVNGLRKAGQERAVAALRSYHRLTDINQPGTRFFEREKFDLEDERLFAIIRLLFLPKDGAGAMPLIDMPWIRKPPPGEQEWPLFPVTVEKGLPLMISPRQLGGGSPQNPMLHLDFCIRNAKLRESPLDPQGSPLEAAENLLASDRWRKLFQEKELGEQTSFIRLQVIEALEPVLSAPECASRTEERWKQWVEDVSKLNPRWDAERQCFVRGGP